MTPYYSEAGIQIFHGDCLEVLPGLAPEIAHLVLTSPPYPGASMWGQTPGDLLALNELAIVGSVRALRDGGVLAWQVADVPAGDHGVMQTTTTTTQLAVQRLGLKWRTHIIWDKGITNPLPAPCFMRRPAVLHLTHEHVLVFHKGGWTPRERTWRKGLSGDWRLRSVWTIAPESAKAIGHKAPFPMDLALRCLDLFSIDGDTVLDPFIGLGHHAPGGERPRPPGHRHRDRGALLRDRGDAAATGGARVVTFFVPGRLTNPLNGSWGGWAKHARLARRWRQSTTMAVSAAGYLVIREGRAHASDPKHVRFLVHTGAPWDDDNLAAACKPLRDGLRDAGLIHDDGAKSGHRFEYAQRVNRRRRGVEITVAALTAGGAG